MSVHAGDSSAEPLAATDELVLLSLGELFFIVKIEIDLSKHVKPVEVKPAEVKPAAVTAHFKTLSKFSYFDSSDKYLKVQLPELAGLKDENVEVSFGDRSLSVKVHDFKG